MTMNRKFAGLLLALMTTTAFGQSEYRDTGRRIYFTEEETVVFKVVENHNSVVVEKCEKGNYRFRGEQRVYELVGCNQFVKFPKAKLEAARESALRGQESMMEQLGEVNNKSVAMGGTLGAFGGYAVLKIMTNGNQELLFNREDLIRGILRDRGVRFYGTDSVTSLPFLRKIGMKNRVATLIRSKAPVMMALGVVAGGIYWGANRLSKKMNHRMLGQYMELMGVYTAVFGIEGQEDLTAEVSGFSSGALRLILQEFSSEL